MTISSSDIDRTFTDQAHELDELNCTVSELRYRLDELAEGQDNLKQRMFSFETDDIEQLRFSVIELESTTEGLQGELAQTRTILRHLMGRFDWLEHHARASAGLTATAMDKASPALRALADKASLAATVCADLMPEMQRNRLQAQINRHDNLCEQRRQHLATAITWSRTLIDCPVSGDEYTTAVTTFRTALDQANRIAGQIASARDSIAKARAQLATDDEHRRTHAATITEGEQAKLLLHRKLRQRVTDAIGDRALFPAWFTIALGYSPPATGTAQWIAAAAELISYRITYAITDPAVALGSQPPPHQAIRAAWYDALTRTLRDQRQWP